MKLLSIIVPLYNSEKYLPKCLDSLLNQDIPAVDYEIILVNDGSPDGSLKLAEEYASKYPNIIVLSQTNKGTSGARNTGIRHATGEYLYFVDPDDYILKNSLKEPLDLMRKESLDMLRFDYAEVDEFGRIIHSTKYPVRTNFSPSIMDGETFMSERLGVACYVWTYIFRRNLIIDSQLFFKEGEYVDDTPWLPQVLLKVKRIDSLDVKRHFYLIRDNSLVRANDNASINKQIEGLLVLLSELKVQLSENQSKKASRWFRMMISHSTVCLLTLIGQYRYEQRETILSRIEDLGIFPLSTVKSTARNKCKVILINFSPNVYCKIISITSSH